MEHPPLDPSGQRAAGSGSSELGDQKGNVQYIQQYSVHSVLLVPLRIHSSDLPLKRPGVATFPHTGRARFVVLARRQRSNPKGGREMGQGGQGIIGPPTLFLIHVW